MKHYRILALLLIALLCLGSGCAQTDPSTAGNAGQPAQAESGNTQVENQKPIDTSTADAVSLVSNIPTTQYFLSTVPSDEDIQTILTAGINAPSAMNGQPWHFSAITDPDVMKQIADGMGGGFGGGMPPSGAAMPGGPGQGKEFPSEGMELPKGAERPDGMELPEEMESPEGMTPPAGGIPAGGSGGLSKAGMTDAPLAIVVSCREGSELDAGLACQNMSVTAQLLGYGSKIISSPTMALNGEKQAEFKELLGIPEDQSAVAVLLIGYEDTSVDETVDGYTSATVRNPVAEMITYVKP